MKYLRVYVWVNVWFCIILLFLLHVGRTPSHTGTLINKRTIRAHVCAPLSACGYTGCGARPTNRDGRHHRRTSPNVCVELFFFFSQIFLNFKGGRNGPAKLTHYKERLFLVDTGKKYCTGCSHKSMFLSEFCWYTQYTVRWSINDFQKTIITK